MAMIQRPTVFIVGRKKNDKKEPTISKAGMDEHVARVETFIKHRDKEERNSNE